MPEQSFRLRTVLSYREFQLDRAVQDVARLQGRIQTLSDATAKLVAEREAVAAGALLASETSAANLHLVTVYVEALEAREETIRKEVAELSVHLESARAVVRERQKAVEVLRRLRERLRAQDLQDEARREQRAMDEVASMQMARREDT